MQTGQQRPPSELSHRLIEFAQGLGFQLAGICPAVTPTGASRLDQWLARGYAGEMDYLAERREAYNHPSHVLDGVRSLLMLGMHYATVEPAEPQPGEGRVSRYAWGDGDYHDTIRDRLHQLADYFRTLVPGAITRGVVDTAPLLECEFAQLAGLGWIGKNTLLLNIQSGSYFFLAALLTDQVLAYDAAHTADHCGTCTACLDACPTEALVEPYLLDASRCISYLTIEHRGAIPRELRSGMGDWLFGCDICQDVCPWNHGVPKSSETTFSPRKDSNPQDLMQLFELDDAEFRNRFRHTPLWRPHRRGLLRNAAVVLGNQRCEESLPALARGLTDIEPLVRSAAAWALGQLQSPSAIKQLQRQRTIEKDPNVQQEIIAAIK